MTSQLAEDSPRIPGPAPLPVLGNLLEMLRAPQETSIELTADYHARYGGIFALDIVGNRQIFASDHRLVAEMCSSPLWSKSVHDALEQIRDFGGDGLFTAYSEEPNWGRAHRLLMPAFGTMAMKDYFPQMLDIAEQLMVRWQRFGSDHTIDVAEDMTRLTLDTIALCAFNVRFNSFYSEKPHPFVGAMVRSLVEAGARPERLPGVQPFLVGTNRQYRTDIAAMQRITDDIVATRNGLPAEDQPDDLLQRMLTAADPLTGEKLSEENIRHQLVTFLVAGHETTSGLLSFATHQLLANPDVLARAREVVDEVLGNRTPRFEDLADLGYLGQILRETLRLHPTAPAFALTPSEPTTLGGHRITPDDSVMVILPVLHQDPEVWPQPQRFDPDRFAPDRMDRIPEYAWMPFGHGARACIGRPFALQEATLVLAMMLQRFDIALADPDYRMTISETLTIKPKDLTIKARARSAAPQPRSEPATAAPHAPTAAEVRPSHGTPMLVLFGSNGGSSESLARTIAGDGHARGWNTEVAPLDDHAGTLPTEGPVVIVTSSYNGTPPDNARRFVDWLTESEPELTGVDYLVLGCGSLDWAATYQRIPTRIDEAMAAAGANRIRERGVTDARTDFFGDWERWYRPLWSELAARYGVADTAPTGPRYRITPTNAPRPERTDATAVVVQNRELTTGTRSKRHLELRLPEGRTYRTGDYLSVLPQNHPELVTRMLTRLGIDPEHLVSIASDAPNGRIPVGLPIRVDDLLTRHTDLSAPATPGVIAALAETTRCTPERRELTELANQAESGERRPSLLHLLERFASCPVDLAWVLERLPEPRARQYSISSAAEVQTEVALTVSVVEGPDRAGSGTYRGAASSYLQRTHPGDRLTVALAAPQEEFRPPADNSVPVVMIAAGSGIAPFRAFIAARRARAEKGEPHGANLLFFGCRHPDSDDLYAEEFAPLVAAGTLQVHRAFSRRPDGDVHYVQHRLWAERRSVLDLVEQGAHLYVCGDVTGMGPAVEECLRRIGPDEDWLDRLRAAGRYATDLF
ncbi:bifunctional cytochrome P450/NADPH--P450 reductase [Actinoalloteichus hymeniacidonis]|uniref:Bifunctional cytochrome P450/NADPH--P450 reductase n=1 Tax=Actinoalloteichus hymeniacidonis TaxID=340345 RepID=A0AAC9HP96_9PSEU|nr:cytochrome P450 [Actinoalloteichus hymeniacidonis]AOS62030.1 sulfite reductase, alpha subunit (flavoprotein) [Actinoalloteichus hymeniacidonis]MBB5909948.1 cytochrome P450/NADPH-cytochrome P450 reductase [Actinoalloteichus hymeniacidonis]